MSNKRVIIINTLKVVIASMCAICVAAALNLQFAISAGIVAILSIQPTKKETIKTAEGRFLAFVCAVIIAQISFWLAGYNFIGFGIYLLCFVGICFCFKWNSAMAMDSVLITHFLSVGNMNADMIINEFLIFLIGTLAGVLANAHLKKDVLNVEKLIDDTDNQIRKILYRMSERILVQDMTDYNGECFTILWNNLRKAQNMAEKNYMNVYASDDVYDMKYLEMRNNQCHVLYEMYKNVRKLSTTPIQAEKISILLKKVSEEYQKDNTVVELMEAFQKLDREMKEEPLPLERIEFEDRARLFALIRLLEEFLNIKKEFMKEYSNGIDSQRVIKA